MHTLLIAAVLAPEEPLLQRLAVLVVCLAVGAWFIVVGRHNVRTRQAEETGKRAALLSLFGKSTERTGWQAVAMGWLRIVLGAFAIVFGFVFLFFGAFLKK